MTNTTFFSGLPNFDDDDLDGQMQRIMTSDRDLLNQIYSLLPCFNWYEKMAIGLIAYHSIDNSHTNLMRIEPIHGDISFSVEMKRAIELVKNLSPEALAEVAGDMLLEKFEIVEAHCETAN